MLELACNITGRVFLPALRAARGTGTTFGQTSTVSNCTSPAHVRMHNLRVEQSDFLFETFGCGLSTSVKGTGTALLDHESTVRIREF